MGLRRRYWKLGAAKEWEDISLLRRAEMQELFEAPVLEERMGRVVKSWVCVGKTSEVQAIALAVEAQRATRPQRH